MGVTKTSEHRNWNKLCTTFSLGFTLPWNKGDDAYSMKAATARADRLCKISDSSFLMLSIRALMTGPNLGGMMRSATRAPQTAAAVCVSKRVFMTEKYPIELMTRR